MMSLDRKISSLDLNSPKTDALIQSNSNKNFNMFLCELAKANSKTHVKKERTPKTLLKRRLQELDIRNRPTNQLTKKKAHRQIFTYIET